MSGTPEAKAATSWDFRSGDLPYRDQLFKTALRLTRSVEDAEDLVQETYLKAYRAYDRFAEGTTLKAWLFRNMNNGLINRSRRRRRLPMHLELDELREGTHNDLTDQVSSASAGPDPQSSVDDMDHQVRDALLALPHDYKMAVLLIDLEGLTYQEAADLLEVPIGTVMSRLYRGRKKLERSLLDFALRYNYLDRPPSRLRDASIDTAAIFGTAASMS